MIINTIFANEPLKTIITEKEVPNNVVQHMLLSADVGNECVKTFVEKQLVKQEISAFDKIKNKLNTGIKELPKKPRLVEVLKEGFEILVAEGVPPNEGFIYPITKLPMGIAEPKTDL